MATQYEEIADAIADKTTARYPNHTMNTHLGCVLLRVGIGLALIDPSASKHVSGIILILAVFVVIVFGFKHFGFVRKNTRVWKSYPRVVIVYAVIAYLIKRGRLESAGTLAIVEAIMGLQSRHTAATITYMCK